MGGISTLGFAVLLASNWLAFRNITLQQPEARVHAVLKRTSHHLTSKMALAGHGGVAQPAVKTRTYLRWLGGK